MNKLIKNIFISFFCLLSIICLHNDSTYMVSAEENVYCSNPELWDYLLKAPLTQEMKNQDRNEKKLNGTQGIAIDIYTYGYSPMEYKDIYTVEFMTDSNALNCTYWCLGSIYYNVNQHAKKNNWKYHGDGGMYGGLQATDDGLTYITSAWVVDYTDQNGNTDAVLPTMVKPEGVGNYFDNEGSGTSYIRKFDWKANNWYRWVTRFWDNEETNTTFFGTWLEDMETGEVTQIAVFDTHIYHARLNDTPFLFLEDYNGYYLEYATRKMFLRNIYYGNTHKKEWYPLHGIAILPGMPSENGMQNGGFRCSSDNGIFSIMTTEYGEYKLKDFDEEVYMHLEMDDKPDIDLNKFAY